MKVSRECITARVAWKWFLSLEYSWNTTVAVALKEYEKHIPTYNIRKASRKKNPQKITFTRRMWFRKPKKYPTYVRKLTVKNVCLLFWPLAVPGNLTWSRLMKARNPKRVLFARPLERIWSRNRTAAQQRGREAEAPRERPWRQKNHRLLLLLGASSWRGPMSWKAP